MKIAVDAMGGDYAPSVVVEGTVWAARELGISIILVGDKTRVEDELAKHDWKGLPISIKHASEVVGMDESPGQALRKKKDSSVKVCFELVKSGEAGAVVSAGNSGAAMAAGIFVLRNLKGVDRPAITVILPTKKEPVVLLDAGGNVDCKPVHLVQFALMGSVYARYILKKNNPAIGLLSNGEEEGKGNELTRETLPAKMGYLLAKGALKNVKKKTDYAEYGGAPLLGINGVGIISHGASNAKAIKNAIRVADECVKNRVNRHLLEELEKNHDLQKLCGKQPLQYAEES